MQLLRAAEPIFSELIQSIEQLSTEEFKKPCPALFQNSIGNHVRHVIELYQCLEKGYMNGQVNYDSRKRNPEIGEQRDLAIGLLHVILCKLDKPNKEMCLFANYGQLTNEGISINTNYYRELAFNLEHAIHHMALIRIGINEISDIPIPANFGLAPATIQHRNQCAQ